MTNLEKLKTRISDTHGVVLTENHFLGALEDNNLESGSTYNKAGDEKALDIAVISVLDVILDTANIGEGNLNYSLSNKESIQVKIDIILSKWGLPTRYAKKAPTIDSCKPW